MFDTLTNNLQAAFQRFGSHGSVTEKDLDTVLRDVRLALLEADVNFRVVKELISRIRTKTSGAGILKSLTPAQHCLLYTSPSPRDGLLSRMPSSA